MATITGGTTKKTRSTKAKVGGAAELRKTISEISDADLTYILGGVLYNDLMLK
jgi:hypothetical protein